MGTMRLGSAAARIMQLGATGRAPQGGRLLVMSSLAGTMPVPLAAPYCAAKHALQGFFSSLRAELAGNALHQGAPSVSVTIVCPGPVVSAGSDSAILSDHSDCRTYTASTRVQVSQAGRMSANRCAQLALAAASAGVSESWMGPQPALALAYISWLCPCLRGALDPTAAAIRASNMQTGNASLSAGMTSALVCRLLSCSALMQTCSFVADTLTLACCACGHRRLCASLWRTLTCQCGSARGDRGRLEQQKMH